MEVLSLVGKQVVADYPYGFKLRTEASFSVEFKKNKGFRSVFQTVNPKNGRINKEKCGTYNTFMCMVKDTDGHIKYHGFNAYGFESINSMSKFISEHFDVLNLTKEQIEELYLGMVATIRGNARYTKDVEKILELIKPTVTILMNGIKTGDNVFGDINLNEEELKKLF